MFVFDRALLCGALVLALAAVGCQEASLKRINDTCGANSDCADDICHRGICASSNPADNGQPCNGAGNCKSLVCVSGLCQQGTRPLTSICRHGQECKSKNCQTGACHASLPPPDGGIDSSLDGPAVDAPGPDLTADMKKDSPAPDAPAVDLPIPDVLVPDLPVPDLPSPDGGCTTCYSKWTPMTPVSGAWRNWSVAAAGQVVLIGGQVNMKDGEIRRSEKGGAFQKVANATRHVTGVAIDGQKAVAVDADGWIHASSDLGKTWTTLTNRCWQYAAIGDIAMLGQFIVATSKGVICWSSDGGKNFSTKKVMYNTSSGVNMKAVSVAVVNGKPTALVVGDYKDTSYNYHHYIYRSSDLGKTWDDLSTKLSATTGYSLNDVVLNGDGKVFMTGEEGKVFLSSDQGNTWSMVSVISKALRTIVFDPGINAVLVGGYSEAYLSTKGGTLFNKLTDPNLTGAMYKAAPNGSGEIYLVEMYMDSGKILKSTR